MKRAFRWAGYGLALLVVIAVAAAAWIWIASDRIFHRTFAAAPEPMPVLTQAQIDEGPRLARVLGCFDCHGAGLRGRLFFDEPNVARVWAPNLTLVAAEASDAQMLRAIRQGIGRDGRALWIMPSGLFSRLPEWQAAAVVKAVRALPRGGQVQPRIRLGPLGRFGIATGKFEPAPATIAKFRTVQPFFVDRAHEPGRQIAATVCADCHAPDLGGGQPGFVRTPPDLSIVGAYDREAFRTLMRTGRPPGGRDLGPMRVAAVTGLSHLRDAEIDALYDYLKARADRLAR